MGWGHDPVQSDETKPADRNRFLIWTYDGFRTKPEMAYSCFDIALVLHSWSVPMRYRLDDEECGITGDDGGQRFLEAASKGG